MNTKFYLKVLFNLFIINLIQGFKSASLQAQCPITVNAGSDIYLCGAPNQTTLDGNINGSYINFFWTPTTGMTGANTLTPMVNVNNTISYILTARAADINNNLVTNGDFEQGNTGFSTDYTYNPGFLLPPFGSYEVNNAPTFFPACPDHSSGGGQYLVVDGSDIANKLVWCQTVAVSPNTDYSLEAWALAFTDVGPFASLRFTINGSSVGTPLSVPPPICQWHPFSAVWNSGANSSATICIEDLTVGGSNNDFGIDDIALYPICTQRDTVAVRVVNIQALANPSTTLIPCAGAHVSLSGAGSSTGQNISYSWDTPDGNIVSGANTLTPVVDQPGAYTLTVAYDYGSGQCTKTASVNVILNPNPLSCWINPPLPLGCGGATLTLSGQASQGTVNYAWSTSNGHIVSGAASNMPVVDQPGTYSLTVTNFVSGCTSTAQTTVTVANNPPTANASVSQSITCTQPQATLSGAGSSTGANIQYNWSTPNGIILGGQTMQNAVAGAGGTYILQVNNSANLCIARDTVIVTADTSRPQIGILPHGPVNCLNDTLALTAQVAPAGLHAQWTASNGGAILSGDTTVSALVATAGLYRIVISNPANGCTAGDSTIVSVDFTAPNAQAAANGALTCTSPNTTLSGAGSSLGAGFSYQWTAGPGANIVSGDTTLMPLVNAAGIYTITVKNTLNGCTSSAFTQVIADANTINAVANAPDTLDCATHSFALNAQGSSNIPNLVYAWSVPAGSTGHIVSGEATDSPLIDAPGTYQLFLTNPANGCTASDLALVLMDTLPPQFSIDNPDTLTCTQQMLTITAQHSAGNGSYAYNWTASAGGNIVSGQTGLIPVVNSPGIYNLLITNNLTSCTAQKSAQVFVETGTPTAQIAAPDTLNCTQTTVILDGTASSSSLDIVYQWFAAGGGHFISGTNTPTAQVDAPGVYQLLLTDQGNGCTATANATVVRDTAAPPADAGTPGLLTCAQPFFNLTANGGLVSPVFQYQWSHGGFGNFTADSSQAQTSCDEPDIYYLTVKNNINNCQSVDSVVVDANFFGPNFSIIPPDTLTCTKHQITLQTQNAGPYTYAWATTNGHIDNGADSTSPQVSAPGQYSATITDPANGCSVAILVNVAQDAAVPVVDAGPDTSLTCVRTQIHLHATVQGGTAGLQFQWTTPNGNILAGANQTDPLVNQPGVYIVEASDPANNCSGFDSVFVSQDLVKPVASAGADDTLNCALNNLTLNGNAVGAHGLSYSWTAIGGGQIASGGDGPNPVVTAAGIYAMAVTDTVNGCSASDAMQVFQNANTPAVSIVPPSALTCAVTQLTLQGSGSSGPNFSYEWTAANGGHIVSGENSLTPIIDKPGLYQLKITDNSNGCTATAARTVSENVALPPVNAVALGVISCNNPEVFLLGSPSGTGFSHQWTTLDGHIVSGANSSKPTVDKQGTYTFIATSLLNGCRDSVSVQAIADTIAPIVSIGGGGLLTCVQKQLMLAGNINLPLQQTTINWSTIGGHFKSGQNSLFPVVDKPGIYQFSAQSQQNGCETLVSDTIEQNIDPPLADAGADTTLTCAHPTLILDAGASVGIGTPAFAWDSPDGQIGNGANTATPLITAPGTYSLTVTDGYNGCTAQADVMVSEDKLLPQPAIATTSLLSCAQDTIRLQAAIQPAGLQYDFEWNTGNGHFASPSDTLAPLVDKTGLYVLFVTNQQNGCTASVSTTVNSDFTAPSANAGPEQTIYCKQPVATLSGTSGTSAPLSFKWSTGNGHFAGPDTLKNVKVDSGGTYILLITNLLNGCTASDLTIVNEIPPPYFAPNLLYPDCRRPNGSITFDSLGGGLPPYKYSIDNGANFGTNPEFDQVPPGFYTVVTADQLGCTASDTVHFETPFYPVITMPDYVYVELGGTTVLMPETDPPFYKIAWWEWSPTEGLSCTDCREPEVNIQRTTTYQLIVSDLSGCTSSKDVQVRVDPTRHVYPPNIFSPDGDGNNDFFTIYARNAVELEYFRIYDRWGSLVWQQNRSALNDETAGWDGRVKGSDPVPGVYVWIARVRFNDGASQVYSGDVTIIR